MLNDRHVLETIPAYVLGSLDEAETRQVAEHLAGCYLCRKELETYQDIADQLLLAVPPATPPAQLKSRLAERVQRLNHKRVPDSAARRLPGRLVPVGAIAGLLLILLLAISNILFWRQAHNSSRSATLDRSRAMSSGKVNLPLARSVPRDFPLRASLPKISTQSS